MSKKLQMATWAFSLIVSSAAARIIDVPGEYATIQEGINNSSNGDTVLVKPGIYYENVNFNGHNIVLASRFILTGNPDYIVNTTINGNSSGSVITFDSGEDSTAVLVGFTITNGLALWGGGIFCSESSPVIRNNEICGNRAGGNGIDKGAGIFCRDSELNIRFNSIYNNQLTHFNSDDYKGGGINADSSNLIIYNNFIYNNRACTGGGIGGVNSAMNISHNIIYDNEAVY